MRKVQLFIGCDMTKATTGRLADADETIYLAVGPDPEHLKVLELDLCQAWAGKFREDLRPYIDAAHKPGEMDMPGVPGNSDYPPPPGAGQRQFQGGAISSAIARNRQMRAWSDKTGFRTSKDEPGYRKNRKGGGYQHSRELQRAYAEYLASVAQAQSLGDAAETELAGAGLP